MYVFPLTLTNVAPGMVTEETPVLSVTSAVIIMVSDWLSVVTLASLETLKLEIVGAVVSLFEIVMVSFTVALLPAVSCA